MEGIYKTVVSLPYLSGKPEDVAENVFYFAADDGTSTQAADIANINTRLGAFYNTTPTGSGQHISQMLGGQVTRTANAAKRTHYFTAGTTIPALWGTPVATTSWTVGTASGATTVPAEVAMVLSFHGDLTDIPETETNPTPPPAIIRPAARRRGRIFVGPLNLTAMTQNGSTGDQQLSSAATLTLAGAGHDLVASNVAGASWCVASKADDGTFLIVGGFVDNALDTQRRRGESSTLRTAWT